MIVVEKLVSFSFIQKINKRYLGFSCCHRKVDSVFEIVLFNVEMSLMYLPTY